ncbi:MAG: M23 family metallopeptidase [Bdellovibrionales bacterium]|nr:M23 family metallopeptidase [Bdellovibrionales bacterium]
MFSTFLSLPLAGLVMLIAAPTFASSAEDSQQQENPLLTEEHMGLAISKSIHISEKKDSLEVILKRAGFAKKEYKAAIRAEILPENYRIIPQTPYLIRKFAKRGHAEVLVFESDRETAYRFQKSALGVHVDLVPMETDSRMVRFQGQIQKNFVISLRKVLPDDRLAQKFVSAFILDHDLSDVAKSGAEFDAVVEQIFWNGKFLKWGELIRSQLTVNEKIYRKYWVQFDRGGAFVGDAQEAKRPLFAPVDYLRVTSVFSKKRFHPFRRRRLPHKGVDLALPKGEPVFAAQDGVVEGIGRSRAGGRFIVIQHADGLMTNYEHLSEYEPGLSSGQKVKAGERIGRVGCTGFCTSPHLHFGLRVDGEFVDPVNYIKPFPQVRHEAVAQFYENFSTSIGSRLEALLSEVAEAVDPRIPAAHAAQGLDAEGEILPDLDEEEPEQDISVKAPARN